MSEEIKNQEPKKQPQKKTAKTVLKGKKNYTQLKVVRGQPISKEAEALIKKAGLTVSQVVGFIQQPG